MNFPLKKQFPINFTKYSHLPSAPKKIGRRANSCLLGGTLNLEFLPNLNSIETGNRLGLSKSGGQRSACAGGKGDPTYISPLWIGEA